MLIHEITTIDYPALAEFFAIVYPDTVIDEASLIAADEQRDPRFHLKRWGIIHNNRIVGAGSYFQREWFYHPQKFRVSVLILPEYRQRGLGTVLYNQVVEALQPLHPIALIADTYENCPVNIRFLEKQGFEIFIRDRELRLDVATFEFTPFGDYSEKLRTHGVEIKSVLDLADDSERNRKLYDLDRQMSIDAPQTEHAPERSLDAYIEFAITGQNAFPEGFFVAVQGENYIGFTQVMLSSENTLYQLLTGVRREYRRRGIAMALKLRSIEHAQTKAIKTIITNNDPQNRDMLALNERLGYVRQPDQLFFQKILSDQRR